LTAESKCQCEIIKNTQWVYLKANSFNGTEEERISTEEIMKHHWLQESQVSHQLKNRKRLTWR
jgi:hypothetical protein